MPKLSEEEWNKIENNVCMVTFLEGIPIGAKVYNNYCVVSNNTNQETVGNDSIYISEFERKTVSITGEDSNAHSQLLGGDVDSGKYAYYYPEAYTPCYSCMVSASQTYSTDDIIKDEVYKVENNQRRKVNITDLGSNHINLRQVYLTALARSRYNLYITNGYFGY